MDGNGWTGLNPGLAWRNIADFTEKGIAAAEEYNKAIAFLFEQLYFTWCSPKAVEFSNLQTTKLYGTYKAIYLHICDISRNAVRAYNIVASANNATRINYTPQDFNYAGESQYTKLLENKDGVVGMNINLVENYILPEFDSKIKNALHQIESLPKAIALYDDETGQQHAFSTGVSALISSASEIISSVESTIQTSIKEEQNTIKLAKEQATQTLSA